MTTVPERLRKARLAASFGSATEAAKAHGWNLNSYWSNENGHRPMSRTRAVDYARAYKVNVEWLLTGQGPMRAGSAGWRKVRILRLKDIEGGATRDSLRALLVKAELLDYAQMPEADYSADVFAIIIEDDAMDHPSARRSLYLGDRVYVDGKIMPKAGNLVVARYNDQFIVRQMAIASEQDDGTPDLVRLQPFNPAHAERIVPFRQVIGVVISFERKV